MLYQPNSRKIVAVAPMMDWTDRHCRYFHRLLSQNALLYTEMVVADAVIHGDSDQLLAFSEAEHPVALQLGGSDPEKLKKVARIGEDFGYDEINLNVGCPSDRVQSGTFGACLMREPALVADCVAAMKSAVSVPVTVKCRIGVDDQVPEDVLPAFVARMADAGVDALWIHARMAWLNGLSPKQNREVPPLNYPLVHQIKADNPDLFIGINGGIETTAEIAHQLELTDGVMVGRAAYRAPALLLDVDELTGDTTERPSLADIVDEMERYTVHQTGQGVRLHHITKAMLGLLHGQPGARYWRQQLSAQSVEPDADARVIRDCYDSWQQFCIEHEARQVA